MSGECIIEVREIESQQVLLPDGCVFSVQSAVYPSAFAEAITPRLLFDRYLKLIRQVTLTIVRPIVLPEAVEFRLLGTSLALLSFAPPVFMVGEEMQEAQLQITGGFLVQAEEIHGVFSFIIEKEPAGVRVTVQLGKFCPLLLGSRSPSLLNRLVYRFTQAYIHQLVTVRYLSELYRELSGSSCRTRVKRVHIKDGIRT